MIEISKDSVQPDRLTARTIVKKALARGWRAQRYTPHSSHIRLIRNDEVSIEISTAMPPTTSYIAAQLSDNKYLTHLCLEEAGLPVVQTFLCRDDNEAQKAAETILDSGASYVVKPLNASHGDGITVGVSDLESLSIALAYAQQYSSNIIVQEYLPDAVDLRLLCINDQFVAALERIPARVVGDGTHTIAELIEVENQSNRGLSYTSDLTEIPIDRVRAHLGGAIHDVPKNGVIRQVLGTANVGTGGETRDVTDLLPQWMKDMAATAVQKIGLGVGGVDFLILGQPYPEMTVEQAHPIITEVNKNPSMFIHETPNHGQPRMVVDEYLDYLARL